MISRPALYVGIVSVAGVAALTSAVLQLIWFPLGDPSQALLLAMLALVSGATVLRLPFGASFSVGDAFSFAALFLFGIEAGTLTTALDTLAISLRLKRPFVPTVFNVAAPSLAMWCAGGAVFAGPGLPLPVHNASAASALVSIAASVLIVFLLGSVLVAGAVALHEGKTLGRVWRQDFAQLWVNPLAGGYLGALIAFGIHRVGWTALLAIAPIPGILYLAFRASVNRVKDHMRHLSDVNRMHQSTVEAFASAVDAKDQVTHGHIRRVQAYCVAVARDLGADDEGTLKALEAAALLHDVGKIGIPEHILNKPGKLSAAEFDVMKEHVAIGTSILSTVEFPFPVVPIVESHHENWDGTGYPAGVRGEDIPLGARILSVVDCFDALTSDRPYRAAMSVAAAFDILLARRGSMYDPHIVDRFIALHPKLPAIRDGVAPPHAAKAPSPVRTQANGTELGIGHLIVDIVAGALPGHLGVAYEVNQRATSVVAVAATGEHANRMIDHTVALGHGVSGWVAASGSVMLESDAELDFPGSSLGEFVAGYRCSSVLLPLAKPLVLTIYGPPLASAARSTFIERLSHIAQHLISGRSEI